MPLISSLSKTVEALAPGVMQGDMAVVSGSAFVPVELNLRGLQAQGAAGVDIVFLVDHSGSMKSDSPYSDPDGERFKCIRTLAREFIVERNAIDRIAIVRFGDGVTVLRPSSPWHTWQEIDTAVGPLITSEPGGGTPMDVGMQKVHELLSAQSSTYRLAILLSDGLPTPDDAEYPQTEIIIKQRVPEARNARILYSTIYLHARESTSPEDNALLAYIARMTDYISQAQLSEPPRYYFRINEASAAAAGYRALFDVLKNRRVPQDVRLVEVLHTRLLVDAESPVSFGGPLVDPLNNVIGTPLAEAIAAFRSTRGLSLTLNELNGWASLRFAVRLDLDSLTPAELDLGFIEIPVNRLEDSSLTWVEPIPGQAGGVTLSAGLPQAKIRFEFGVRVGKTLSGDGNIVRIDIANLAREPIYDFELLECPTGFAERSAVEDDFGFDPVGMLHEHRIIPWFIQQIPEAQRPPPGPLRNQIKAKLRQAHAPLLQLRTVLGPLLGEFSFIDQAYDVDTDKFWRAREGRGLYRLAQRIESKGVAFLQLELSDASFLLQGDAPQALYAHADAVSAKEGDPQPSKYRARGWAEEKEVLPNPKRLQLVPPGLRPDLCLRTALNINQWKEFAALFHGSALSSPTIDPWSLLDSPDIEPWWRHTPQGAVQAGVRVRVLNGGQDVAAGRHLKVQALYLPITGEEAAPPFKPAQSFVGQRNQALPAIPESTSAASGVWVNVPFTSLVLAGASGPNPQPVPADLLGKVKKAIVVVTVEIEPAPGELMLSNNRAVEIAALVCS